MESPTRDIYAWSSWKTLTECLSFLLIMRNHFKYKIVTYEQTLEYQENSHVLEQKFIIKVTVKKDVVEIVYTVKWLH